MTWGWLATRVGIPFVVVAAFVVQAFRLSVAEENLSRAHKALNETTAQLVMMESLWAREREAVSERATRAREMELEDEAFARNLADGSDVGDDFWERLCRRPGAPSGDSAGSGDLPDGG